MGTGELTVWVIVIAALISGLIGLMIGSSKGKPGAGFWLGLLLGWIGWIIAAVMSRTPEVEAQRNARVAAAAARLAGVSGSSLQRLCPYCAELIKSAAVVCRHCGRDVEPVGGPVVVPGESWFPDPYGRHPDRWWDGTAWTKWVRDKPGGTRSEDPPVPWATP